MPLVVQKFGGSSVANLDRIKRVAGLIKDCAQQGNRVVVVVSAMGGETDRLSSLAAALGVDSGAELDVLLASGEQASAALLAMALQKINIEAASFCGHQVAIRVSEAHQQACIESVESKSLQLAMEQGITPIIAGFQGVNSKGRVMTLGRGGSDLTAVAVAAALRADECRIYTDMDGIYTADPRVVANAAIIDEIALPLMTEYAQAGAGILQNRCLDLASKESVMVRVLSSYASTGGTQLIPSQKVAESSAIIGVATKSGYQLLQITDLPNRPGILSYCFAAFKKIGLNYEMAQFNQSSLTLALSSAMAREVHSGLAVFLAELSGDSSYKIKRKLGKVTIIGSGLEAEQNVLLTTCSVLSREGVDPLLLSSCSTRIEVLVPDSEVERLTCALHEQLFDQ